MDGQGWPWDLDHHRRRLQPPATAPTGHPSSAATPSDQYARPLSVGTRPDLSLLQTDRVWAYLADNPLVSPTANDPPVVEHDFPWGQYITVLLFAVI